MATLSAIYYSVCNASQFLRMLLSLVIFFQHCLHEHHLILNETTHMVSHCLHDSSLEAAGPNLHFFILNMIGPKTWLFTWSLKAWLLESCRPNLHLHKFANVMSLDQVINKVVKPIKQIGPKHNPCTNGIRNHNLMRAWPRSLLD